MKSKEYIKKWLLKNAVTKNGHLDLIGLDFSDFDGDVYINHMKVKGNLWQNCQKVGGDLHQDFQDVGKDLSQDCNNVGGDLSQMMQTVGGEFFNHKLKDNEYWETYPNYSFVFRKKSQ